MTGDDEEGADKGRKPRADAQRNRLRLIAVAKAAFAELGPDVSREEIARRAGVGIGTLYRHFPTRDAVIEAVYRREVQQLVDAANDLATEPPVAALRAWLLLFVDYIGTKKMIAPALSTMAGGPSDLYAASLAGMERALTMLVDRAVASGDIKLDLDPLDLLRALAGVLNAGPGPEWAASARGLVDILIAGMRVPREAPNLAGDD